MSLDAFPKHNSLKLSFPIPFVLQITISRPPLNAFNKPLWLGLKDVVDVAATHPDVRVIVLHSANPKIFSAGIDVAELAQLGGHIEGSRDPSRNAVLLERTTAEFQNAISALEKSDKPIIAAINGVCIGLGVDIVSACDIRWCSADAKFSIKEAAMGLAADIGSLQRFPKKVGNDSLARELVFSARDFTAEEASKIGYVSNVVPGGQKEVLAAALKLAENIAALSPIAVQGSKRIMNYSMNHSIDEALHYQTIWNQAMLQSADLKEAVTAFLQKRKATYAKL
ncbi:ClpP/crotonase [Atractiella rhizophila]|nr:ClpP/crotonase [Atractiella rhizophila]